MSSAPGILVNIDVDDLEAALAFYTSTFGLRIGRRLGADAVEVLGASAPLYFLAKAADTSASPKTSQVRTYARHWTPVHLDFVVDDIESTVKSAIRSGATVELPMAAHNWGRIAVMADPFGHGFCIIQFLGRGYDEIASEQRT
ncbi:VOC family protein [Rhodoferax ferrireducens]|uniref:VOC family protein n=1 Tax=Rhodoferax ferrireducens TaxID=192843 RepID=UPI000E0D8C0D|nr:VOC family protein [Rhodoferax ferrireducens]